MTNETHCLIVEHLIEMNTQSTIEGSVRFVLIKGSLCVRLEGQIFDGSH